MLYVPWATRLDVELTSSVYVWPACRGRLRRADGSKFCVTPPLVGSRNSAASGVYVLSLWNIIFAQGLAGL